MPITKSAQKALRQSKRRHEENLARTKAYKIVVKNIRKLVAAGKNQEAQTLLPKLYKTLDKAAKKNTIKKNKAARLKSRLTKLVNKK